MRGAAPATANPRGGSRGLVLLLLVFLPACGQEAAPPTEEALAQRLLHDRAEIEAYLEAFPAQDYEVHDVPSLGRFYLDDNPAQVKAALRRGDVWEPHVVAEFEKHVRPGSVVLDVGAHIGTHTVSLARLVGPEGRVYAFEPQRKVFRELVYNLRLNEIRNAIPLRFAVSSEPGILEMSPLEGADGQVQIGRGGDRVEARTIDSFAFADVSLMKVDVEGHEVPVLEGARQTIERSYPAIIVETIRHKDEVFRLLAEHGYGYEVIHPYIGAWHDYIAVYQGGEPRDR